MLRYYLFYSLLSFLIVVSCSTTIETPIFGQWSLAYSEYQKDIYREIKFNKNFSIEEFVDGTDEFQDNFQLDKNSIIIRDVKFDYALISNDTLKLSAPSRLYILRRVKSEELDSKNRSHFLRRFEYLGKNYQHLDSIKIERWKNEMVTFFTQNADYPTELDNYPDFEIKSGNDE